MDQSSSEGNSRAPRDHSGLAMTDSKMMLAVIRGPMSGECPFGHLTAAGLQ